MQRETLKEKFKNRVDLWQKAFDHSAEQLKRRTFLSMQSSVLLTILFGIIIILISVGWNKGSTVSPATQSVNSFIVAVIALVIMFIVALHWTIGNAINLIITSKVIKGTPANSLNKLTKAWVIMNFLKKPAPYLLPPTEEELKMIEQLKNQVEAQNNDSAQSSETNNELNEQK